MAVEIKKVTESTVTKPRNRLIIFANFWLFFITKGGKGSFWTLKSKDVNRGNAIWKRFASQNPKLLRELGKPCTEMDRLSRLLGSQFNELAMARSRNNTALVDRLKNEFEQINENFSRLADDYKFNSNLYEAYKRLKAVGREFGVNLTDSQLFS